MDRYECTCTSLKVLAAGAAIALVMAVTASGCGRGSSGETATIGTDRSPAAEQTPANGGRRLQPEAPATRARPQASLESGEQTFTTVLTPRRAVTVMSRISGTVTALEVEEGARVRADGILARLDDRSRTIARDRAAAEEQRTRAIYERNQRAFDAAAQVRVVSALDLEVSEAEYNKARADLALAELELGYTQIEAPFAGVVTERFIEQGEWIAAQEDLFTVADLNRLWAIFIVPADALNVLSGSEPIPLRIVTDGRSLDADGRLVRTSPVIDPASGGVKITLEIANAQGLYKPGMTATLTLDAPGG
jgi:RND family efflux transporter MFP subunit